MEMIDPTESRVTLEHLRRTKAAGEKFAMLTAYDHPTAVAAQAAGVPTLLIGDSMGSVVLGQESTRAVPLDLMIYLGEAVRRGAPNVFLVGDLPYESVRRGVDGILSASERFVEEAGCDAVKIETFAEHEPAVRALVEAGYVTIAHLGLRPQSVVARAQLKAQARDQAAIAQLVSEARLMVDAGAQLLLLEAIPNQAAQAVVDAFDVPVIGCGAGPACDAHVVVTHDMLGIGSGRPPRFVPVHAHLSQAMEDAMRRFVAEIANRDYPGPEHVYGMRKNPVASSSESS